MTKGPWWLSLLGLGVGLRDRGLQMQRQVRLRASGLSVKT